MTTNQAYRPGSTGVSQKFSRRSMRRFSLGLCLAVGLAMLVTPSLADENKKASKSSAGVQSGQADVDVGAATKKKLDYALIFGTLWSADNRPVHGAEIKIRRSDQKRAKWALVSDRRGEFAQRLPVGKADYIVWAELPKRKGHLAETTVHIEGNERADINLRLPE